MPIEAESRGRTTRTSKHTPTAWRRSNVKERNLSATFDRIASDASPSADIGNKSNVAALHSSEPTAFFLSDTTVGLDEGAHFLDRLTADELTQVRADGRQVAFKPGQMVFTQGDAHEGIFIIDRGLVRVFYSAPSGREITLAYWTPGHFVGGPEIYGRGSHIWSGEALEHGQVTILTSNVLQGLITRVPNFALALVDGLVAKGKCYSAMAQMLGTRSVIERLAQYLLNMVELYGVRDGSAIIINRRTTHDRIAAMVGSTRQWVTMMLKRFEKDGILSVDAGIIRIARPERLSQIVFKQLG